MYKCGAFSHMLVRGYMNNKLEDINYCTGMPTVAMALYICV